MIFFSQAGAGVRNWGDAGEMMMMMMMVDEKIDYILISGQILVVICKNLQVMCQTSQSRHIDNDIELCKWVLTLNSLGWETKYFTGDILAPFRDNKKVFGVFSIPPQMSLLDSCQDIDCNMNAPPPCPTPTIITKLFVLPNMTFWRHDHHHHHHHDPAQEHELCRMVPVQGWRKLWPTFCLSQTGDDQLVITTEREKILNGIFQNGTDVDFEDCQEVSLSSPPSP